MATGRLIVNAITKDKRINDLSCDTSRLAFTWLITFADVDGKINGDPAIVRSLVFPRRTDISVEDVQSYITEWAMSGLVLWYELEDDLWIYFTNFDKNQKGLRKDREAPSRVPDPPHAENCYVLMSDELRSKYGVNTDQIPVKLKEVKLKEVNRISGDDNLYLSIWTEVTGMLAYPAKSRDDIPYMIQAIYTRHKDNSAKFLEPYYKAWTDKGYKKTNPGWLEWGLAEQMPGNTPSQQSTNYIERINANGEKIRIPLAAT